MAKQGTVFQPKTFNHGKVTIVNADGSTEKAVFVGGADDSVLKSLVLCSNDTSDREIQLLLYDGTNSFVIGTVNVPLGAGTVAGTPPVDGLPFVWLSLDSNGKKQLQVKNGFSLRAKALTTVTAAKAITIVAFGNDY